MSEKSKGNVDFLYPKGFFQDIAGFEPFQVYRVYDCEIGVPKMLYAPQNAVSMFLLFCSSGSGTVTTVKSTYEITPESLLFFPAAEAKSVMVSPKETQHLRLIVVEFAVMSRGAGNLLSSVSNFYLACDTVQMADNMSVIRPFMSNVISELSVPAITVAVAKGALTQVLIVAFRGLNCHGSEHTINETSAHAVGHTVYAIVRYIDEHLYSMNHLMGMAKDLGYSYNYLSHLFRRKTGMTIQAYVSRKKIEKSLELLAESPLSITEIASKLNYDCIQSFSKAFKKAMNMSPTEYRAKHGVEQQDNLI